MEVFAVLAVTAAVVVTRRIRAARCRPFAARHVAAYRLSGRHGGWFTGRHRDVALLTTSAVVLLGVARVGWWLR